MQSTAKAEKLISELKDRLSKRYAGSSTIDTVREARDSDGFPYLMCSDGGVETAGSPVIMIRIKGVDMVSKDVFNNATKAYAPHLMQIAWEADSADDEPSKADYAKALFEAIPLGCAIDFIRIADATAVTPANADAATPIASLDNLYWPKKGV